MKTRKIILFIVEGITDKTSLGRIINKIIKCDNIRFHIVGGDITTDKFTTSTNALTRVNVHVKKFLNSHFLRKSDLLKVVHLMDTDGAYVDNQYITVENNIKGFVYSSEMIKAQSVEVVLQRNVKKQQILNRLETYSEIAGIPYSMYYFSCNLEHILHNKINMDDRMKMEVAEEFSDSFYGKENEFIDFISDKEFAVAGDLKETWDFIKQGNHSLKRYCNFHLFFK